MYAGSFARAAPASAAVEGAGANNPNAAKMAKIALIHLNRIDSAVADDNLVIRGPLTNGVSQRSRRSYFTRYCDATCKQSAKERTNCRSALSVPNRLGGAENFSEDEAILTIVMPSSNPAC